MLLLGAMALADGKSFYLEQEELLEGREIEREELKEGSEGRDWIKLLFSGGPDFHAMQVYHQIRIVTADHIKEITQRNCTFDRQEIPLFLMYCCLRTHLS